MVKEKFISIGATLALVLALMLMPMASPVMAGTDTAGGEFDANNVAPTVATPTVTAMTPQTDEWVNVSVTDNNLLSDLATVETVLFYNATGSYSDPGASPANDNQTLIVMTWYAANNTFVSHAKAGSTWSVSNTTSTHDALTGYTGDWKFSFQPGKVATENTTGGWYARVNATDNEPLVGTNHTTGSGASMQWYGEIVVSTETVDFGSINLGSAFATNNKTADVKNIANGNYTETAMTDNGTAAVGTWDNTTAITVTLATDGSPGTGEFSLAIDDTTTFATSVNMSTTYQEINNAGVQTEVVGYPAGNHGLWLALGSEGIAPKEYSGTIHFQIQNRA